MATSEMIFLAQHGRRKTTIQSSDSECSAVCPGATQVVSQGLAYGILLTGLQPGAAGHASIVGLDGVGRGPRQRASNVAFVTRFSCRGHRRRRS